MVSKEEAVNKLVENGMDAELHQKVKKEIQDIKYQIKRSIDWGKGE